MPLFMIFYKKIIYVNYAVVNLLIGDDDDLRNKECVYLINTIAMIYYLDIATITVYSPPIIGEGSRFTRIV